jgi:hypothetical protein
MLLMTLDGRGDHAKFHKRKDTLCTDQWVQYESIQIQLLLQIRLLTGRFKKAIQPIP